MVTVRRTAFVIVLLATAAAFGQQTYARPGAVAPNATTVQGCHGAATGCIPVDISGTISSAGAADTVGNSATFNGNSVCATVLLAGQLGAGFFLAAGTSTATYTPALSEDATPASPGCTGGNWTPSAFVDTSGNASATIATTNPNAFQQYGIKTLAGSRCARVCTGGSGTTGSATGLLIATTVPSPPPAAGADVTDRPGRQLGKVYGSDGNVVATANTGRLQVDVPSVAPTGAAVPGSATYGGMNVAGNLTGLTGTANGLKVDGSAVTQPISAASLPLPTGAATESALTTVNSFLDSIDGNTGSFSTAQGSATALEAGPLVQAAATTAAPTYLDGKTYPFSLTLAGRLRVDGAGTTQPISAASLPLPSGAAQDSTLTGGTAKAIVRGGAKGATAAADVTSTANGIDHQGLDVQLYTGGAAIDPRQATLQAGSTTAVTQATPANLQATVTGAVVGHGTAATAMRVELPTDGTGKVGIDQTTPGTTNGVQTLSGSTTAVTNITGTVTLPTNAAQETGGNLATIAGKDFATSAKQDTQTTAIAETHAANASTAAAKSELSGGIDPTGLQRPLGLDQTGAVKTLEEPQVRQLLEQLVRLQRVTVLLLQQIKDPGPSAPVDGLNDVIGGSQ